MKRLACSLLALTIVLSPAYAEGAKEPLKVERKAEKETDKEAEQRVLVRFIQIVLALYALGRFKQIRDADKGWKNVKMIERHLRDAKKPGN